ncbi:response regulator [Natronomonas halophila]|uniref:response regulator n=1 Tax=Natronomonas halophila TaxID=2747817 RepID=UPI0015B4A406|nr:response regulator [Natronomonas halophila]QLD87258.1 response regulator [Natronomonas halophila]
MSENTNTVLVVDDEPNVAEGYALWLEDEYDVRVATGGEEALEKLPDVDAVLLDRRMPGMSGDEVLERIRGGGYDCRVAMVTAVDPDFDIIDMPFDAYLTKPVEREDLQAAVDQLLTLSEYDEAVQEQFQLAEKRATLEMKKPRSELEESAEYEELTERLAELEETTTDLVGSMDHETFSSTVRDL